jgi:CDP-diacylglycerol--glycerol-3-phosphate 3-phosphatidyltransferase
MSNSGNTAKTNLIEKSAKSIFNLPNIITMARILCVPFFVWSLFAIEASSTARWFSVLIFIVIMISDGVDGAIARKRGLITNLGKLLDPIADKALLGGALVALSILGEFSWWVTIVILVRELGITAYRLVVVQREVVAASSGGKLKTILQSVLIGSLASPLEFVFAPWYINLESALTILVLLITVYTGVQYMVLAGRARSKRINQ